GMLWLVIVALGLPQSSFIADVAALLLFAFFVIMPLVLRLVVVPLSQTWPARLGVVVIGGQPLAALIAGAAMLPLPLPLPLPLSLRVMGASVWLFYTLLVAACGIQVVWQQQQDSAAWCRGAALIYLPIGAAWYLAAQAHIAPLGLARALVWLTAAHFHYIPLVALTMTGLVGAQPSVRQNRLAWLVYRAVAAGMLGLPLLVALGISLTQLTGNTAVETLAALLQALTVLALGGLLLRYVVPASASPLARTGLAVAGGAVFVSMAAAGGFALGNATGGWAITYSQMLLIHGGVNALLFGACGLWGWVANAHDPRPHITGER
ncbi:MAG: YndJ family transporter, partial [Ktedonobacterales bacterium]|nr:YndJ family transporter [Ktedonobacterales bacterium]